MKLNASEVQPEEVGLMIVYKVLSTSGVTHYFGVTSGLNKGAVENDYFCSCPGFHYRQTCKHVDSLKEQ